MEKRTERITEIAVVAGIIMLIAAVIIIAFFAPRKAEAPRATDIFGNLPEPEPRTETVSGTIDLVQLDYSLPNQTAGMAEPADMVAE